MEIACLWIEIPDQSSAVRQSVCHAMFACVLWIAALPAVAEDITEPAAIREAALAALGVSGTPSEAMVDSALRMRACATPLQARASGPRTAEVRCGDTPGWRVYVPVRVRKDR